MHDTIIKLKDGTERCAPIWEWRPVDGYFTLAGEVDDTVYLADVESAITPGQRTGKGVVDRDELARARENGWDGSDPRKVKEFVRKAVSVKAREELGDLWRQCQAVLASDRGEPQEVLFNIEDFIVFLDG